MKKIITSILLLFAAIVIHAQDKKPVKETGKQLILAPADLVITDISFVSGSKNAMKGKYFITVSITITNQGDQPTGDFKLVASQRRTGLHGEEWAIFGAPLTVTSISGTTSVAPNFITRNFVFVCNLSDLGRGTYTVPFKVTADFYGAVREQNEDNNDSADIEIELVLGS